MNINLSSIWTMLVGTAIGIVYIFTNFVSMSEFSDLKTDLAYDSYYEILDRLHHAESEGNQALAEEYSRRLERLRATICENDPEWERCE